MHLRPQHFCSASLEKDLNQPMAAVSKNKKVKQKTRPEDELDCEGLAHEWDSCEDIRGRLRDGLSIKEPDTSENVSGCAANASLLVPILTRMSLKDGRPLPPIHPLRDQLDKLMCKNKRGETPETAKEVIDTSWSLKKMCGFVKMKTRREEVSTASRHQISIWTDCICQSLFVRSRSHHFQLIICFYACSGGVFLIWVDTSITSLFGVTQYTC